MKLTTHAIRTHVPQPLTVLVASDLHGRTYQNALTLAADAKPDLILCPGDMMEYTATISCLCENNRLGFAFMKQAAAIAPLYYSLGNHERGMSRRNLQMLQNANIRLLDNESVVLPNGITIGGLTSGYVNAIRQLNRYPTAAPDTAFLQQFAVQKGFKILLCHHPEYYPTHLRSTAVDLVVSGHAHGGQWRLFGHGVLAPGQGIWPRYTADVHENRLCISRGMANTVSIPRFFNPRELLLLRLLPTAESERTKATEN